MVLPPYRCSICRLLLQPNSASALYCGHTFHQQCIREWLKEAKTCPLCRVRTSQSQIVLHLYFEESNSFTQDSSTISDDEAQILRNSLRLEKQKAEEAKDDLLKCKQELKRFKSLYESEKKIIQRQATLQDKVKQLEAMLQNYQLIEKQLVEHKHLLRASEFYALLSKDCEKDTKEKMKEYLTGGDQLDLAKFLDLSQSQTFFLKKKLKNKVDQLNAAEEQNLELRRKIQKYKQLVIALKEEISSHGQSNPQETLLDQRLSKIVTFEPNRRLSFGFSPSREKEFSPTIVKSAYNEKRHRSVVNHLENNSIMPPNFNDDSTESAPVSNKSVTSSCDFSQVSMPVSVLRRVKISPKKKSDGNGGVVRPPLPSANMKSERIRGLTGVVNKKRIRRSASLREISKTRKIVDMLRNTGSTTHLFDDEVLCLE